jgi:hypothetical protein
MANRLAFDIGLHLDCRSDDIPEHEIRIRQMVMKSAIVIDKYWALFLGRPTSIKSQDIGVDLLAKRFNQLASFNGMEVNLSNKRTPPRATNAEIYEYLIELMELAGKIVETRDNNQVTSRDDVNNLFAVSESEETQYLHVISLDRSLQNYYRRLPDHLTWKPANIKAAPMSFFLLHQQYHVSMILLHRPWARYGSIHGDGSSTNSHPSPDVSHQHQPSNPTSASGMHLQRSDAANLGGLGLGDPQSIVDDSRTSLSRNICTQQAIRVARIFWQHRQRFDGRRICITAVQHAGTAAIALIAALAYSHTTDADRRSYLNYLEILAAALADMSAQYVPALRMHDLLQAVLGQLREDIVGADHRNLQNRWDGAAVGVYGAIPARREMPSDSGGTDGANKRRRAASRRASEFARPPPPFFTPPGSAGAGFVPHHVMSGSLFGEHNAFTGLDFLGDASEEACRNAGGDDYVLVTPSSDGWALDGLGGGEGIGLLNLPSAEWMAGPAGLSASEVVRAGGGATVKMPSSAGAAPGGDDGDAGQTGDGEAKDEVGEASGGGMEWMGSEGGLNALSPVSLSGLVNAVSGGGKGGGSTGDNGGSATAQAVGGRNHELDFFSF